MKQERFEFNREDVPQEALVAHRLPDLVVHPKWAWVFGDSVHGEIWTYVECKDLEEGEWDVEIWFLNDDQHEDAEEEEFFVEYVEIVFLDEFRDEVLPCQVAAIADELARNDQVYQDYESGRPEYSGSPPPSCTIDPFSGREIWFVDDPSVWYWYAKRAGAVVRAGRVRR